MIFSLTILSSGFLTSARNTFYINFIVAPVLTENAIEVKNLFNYKVQIERPVEIVLKKLFYRANELKVRDVVDAVAILRVE